MENLFLEVFNMSITASYVILFVIVARLLLKRAPKIFSYALWSVVFFRLICPFSFESMFSLIRVNTQTVSPAIMTAQTPQINSGIPVIDRVANQTLNQSIPAPTFEASANPMQVLVGFWEGVWLIGVGALLLYSVFTALKLYDKLGSAEHVYGKVFEMEGIKTPFVFGLFRPKIYLPSGLSENEKTYIIRHEETHIKRFDHIIKPLAFFVLCIHWFNPLAWVAFFLMGEDMELSCDESVIRQLGSDIKKDYSSSLLALSAGGRIVGGCPLAFGESSTKGRIMNILNYKKPAFWVVAAAVIAVAALGIGLLANPQGEQLTEEDYAEGFIQEQLTFYEDAQWANFENVETEILRFERLDRFEGILDDPVEIWVLEYRWKPEDIQEQALGNVKFEDGWLVEDADMGFSALVFSYKNSKPQYMGRLFTNDGVNGNGDSVAGRETLLRVSLEGQGLLPPETYAGEHIIVKFPLSTGETCQLLLSQPATQGEGGIWCVERWMDGNGTVYYDIPNTEGRISEYYEGLQEQFDEGGIPGFPLDPLQVALDFINGGAGLGQRVSPDDLEVQYNAAAQDFLETPESYYIGFISNFNKDEYSNPFFHFDQIQWLTFEDAEILEKLNIDPDDLPNGYYIHNPVSYPMYHQASEQTEYKIIGREPGDSGPAHKSVTVDEFAEYLEQFGDFIPPFHLVTKDGYVLSVTEQYVP